jgi:hypothetical protein
MAAGLTDRRWSLREVLMLEKSRFIARTVDRHDHVQTIYDNIPTKDKKLSGSRARRGASTATTTSRKSPSSCSIGSTRTLMRGAAPHNPCKRRATAQACTLWPAPEAWCVRLPSLCRCGACISPGLWYYVCKSTILPSSYTLKPRVAWRCQRRNRRDSQHGMWLLLHTVTHGYQN